MGFMNFLAALGRRSLERKGEYVSQREGQYVNVGTRYEEDWEWRSKTVRMKRKRYVCVFNIEDDYIISVSPTPKSGAIEAVACNDDLDEEIAVRMLKAGYERVGNVVIGTPVVENVL